MDFIKRFKWVIIGVIIAIIIVTLLTVVFIKTKKVNVEDDVKVEFKGYNGSGTANIKDSAYNKIIGKLLAQALRQSDFKNKEVLETIEKGNVDHLDIDNFTKSEQRQFYKAGKILENIDFDFNKKDKLSNGDKVKLKFKIKRNVSKEYQLKAKEFTKEYTVSGLKNPDSVNAKTLFESLNPTFTGLNGSGQLHLVEKDLPDSLKDLSLSSFEFTVPNNGKLKNGDTVKLEVPKEVINALNESESTNFKGAQSYEIKVKDLKDINQLENVSALFEEHNKLINDRFENTDFSKYSTEQVGQYYKTSQTLDSDFGFSSDEDETSEKIKTESEIEPTKVTLITAYKVTETSKYSDPEEKYVYSGYRNYILEGNRLTKDEATEDFEDSSSEESLDQLNKSLNSDGYIALS